MKKGPYKMKGSPHKLGTIEGTEAHKASMAKFTVEQTRTSADAGLLGTELGSSYIPHEQSYKIKTGFKIEDKEDDDDDTPRDPLADAPTEKMPRRKTKKVRKN